MRISQTLFYVLVSIGIGYLLILLLMYLLQSKMIYHPTRAMIATPSSVGLQFENIRFETEDDLSLHGWFIPADSAAPTVLYFHGNAGNISGRIETLHLLHDLGLNVFMFDYRGYGKSQGTPTETGTYRDATAAWNYLTKTSKTEADQIIIMGRSLGGSIAAWLAARQDPAAVIMESTFTSAADLGADLYPWLPVRWMLKYDYNTLAHIREIDEPIFMAHSKDDQIVPYHHGQQLFEIVQESKRFIELRGSHGSAFWETGEKYREGLKQFLEENTSLNSGIKE
ncbi:hypothetical protein LX73_1928 [Fodinibius salinus]|uniref:AB hydrolase-1 domain-containing protein n=1 Tax=Fodinibius salinus TaxID=860790 RepID=A0A5D3YJE1_9BACT|nr:alpha/beta hydrolase [Fodinibius salinus]TYP92566.1 hypothetical protein LX73_1928 [Fodinibius salinus]